jgi:hypothetical protein
VPGTDEARHAALQLALRSARALPQAAYVRRVLERLLELSAAAPDVQEGWYDLIGAIDAADAGPMGFQTYYLRDAADGPTGLGARGISVYHSALLSDVSSSVWPAALLLADAVAALARRVPAAFEGRPMVELGAGSVLSGQLIAASGAVPVSTVLLTDGDGVSTARLRGHLRLNGFHDGGDDCGGFRPVVTAGVLEWAAFASSADAPADSDGLCEAGAAARLDGLSRQRVVIGSDLVYDPSALSPLAGTLRRLLSGDEKCPAAARTEQVTGGGAVGARLDPETAAKSGGDVSCGITTPLLRDSSFGVVATTVRNPDTYGTFLAALSAAGLVYRDVTSVVSDWIAADGGSIVDTRTPGTRATEATLDGRPAGGAAGRSRGESRSTVQWDIRVAIVTASIDDHA